MSATPPICCVTGRIAGDGFACGDCDPCGAAHTVPDAVKALLKERDEWVDKYASAAETSDTALTRIRELERALKPFAEIARRLGMADLADDDPQLDQHVLEAYADDIAPGAVYCLHVSAFRAAAALSSKDHLNALTIRKEK